VLTDAQLLADYCEHRSESAFAELVSRYIDLVYSVAMRTAGDAHLAEDVTQRAFIALAQNAHTISKRAVLSGWLHGTTRNIAAQTVRTDVRRRLREQEAASMNELVGAQTDENWDAIAPHLDSALGELSSSDREAVLLRYFEQKSAREMASVLDVSDEAAQRRVSRAVERLRQVFARRGIKVSAGGLVLLLPAHSVLSAPAGLSLSIAASAFASAVSTTTALTKAIAMTTLQKTAIGITLAAVLGVGVYEAHQASVLRDDVRSLRAQQTPLQDQISQLQRQRDEATNQLALIRDENALLKRNTGELMQLRGQSHRATADAAELARLKSSPGAGQAGQLPDYMTNAMALGMATAQRSKMKDAQARLGRMAKVLNLTDDQVQTIKSVITNHLQTQSRMALEMATGRFSPDRQKSVGQDRELQESDIKAVLTQDQLAAYPDFLQSEKEFGASTSAQYDAQRIAEEFSLPQDKQEQIRSLLYTANLNAGNDGAMADQITAAKKDGNYVDAAKLSLEQEKSQLESKVQALSNVLSPEQVGEYRKERMNEMALQESAVKMLQQMSAKPAAAGN
jgi:RNA polymerase sigma factor (sigma-70 family)